MDRPFIAVSFAYSLYNIYKYKIDVRWGVFVSALYVCMWHVYLWLHIHSFLSFFTSIYQVLYNGNKEGNCVLNQNITLVVWLKLNSRPKLRESVTTLENQSPHTFSFQSDTNWAVFQRGRCRDLCVYLCRASRSQKCLQVIFASLMNKKTRSIQKKPKNYFLSNTHLCQVYPCIAVGWESKPVMLICRPKSSHKNFMSTF